MYKISKIRGIEVFDSRGFPTIQVFVNSDCGSVGSFSVPSGMSKSLKECPEIRCSKTMSVSSAINKIKEIEHHFIGKDPTNQNLIDDTLRSIDSTNNFSKIGGNVSIGISAACTKLSSILNNISLNDYINKSFNSGRKGGRSPIPMMNLVNGGLHGNENIFIQEFMIVIDCNKSFKEKCFIARDLIFYLKREITNKNGFVGVGDEGGFVSNFKNVFEILDLLSDGIERCGYSKLISIGLDVAASSFYEGNGKYVVDKKHISSDQLLDIYSKAVKDYNISSIEDPFDEGDDLGFKEIMKLFGSKVKIVGDDIVSTNKLILEKAFLNNICNSVIIKPNQIGTITDCIETIKFAQSKNIETIFSHRSGDTSDTFISSFAFGMCGDKIKFGSLCRSERVEKYNEIIRIEEGIY